MSSQPALQSPPVLKKGLLACDENHPSCFFMFHDSRAKDQRKFFPNPTVPNLLIHFQRPQRAPSPRRRCRPPLPEVAAGSWEAPMPTLESSPTRSQWQRLEYSWLLLKNITPSLTMLIFQISKALQSFVLMLLLLLLPNKR